MSGGDTGRLKPFKLSDLPSIQRIDDEDLMLVTDFDSKGKWTRKMNVCQLASAVIQRTLRDAGVKAAIAQAAEAAVEAAIEGVVERAAERAAEAAVEAMEGEIAARAAEAVAAALRDEDTIQYLADVISDDKLDGQKLYDPGGATD